MGFVGSGFNGTNHLAELFKLLSDAGGFDFSPLKDVHVLGHVELSCVVFLSHLSDFFFFLDEVLSKLLVLIELLIEPDVSVGLLDIVEVVLLFVFEVLGGVQSLDEERFLLLDVLDFVFIDSFLVL